MLIAMSESGGTMSFSLWRKDKDGGSSRLILKTLGSIRSLCPVTGPSVTIAFLLWLAPERLLDLDTSPGTDD